MTEYKHIPVYEATLTRFRKIKTQLKQAQNGKFVTDDDALNSLCEKWEEEEAGVTP